MIKKKYRVEIKESRIYDFEVEVVFKDNWSKRRMDDELKQKIFYLKTFDFDPIAEKTEYMFVTDITEV
jgi:metal-sulfur cluster biosynthetic enzyme